MGTIRETRAKLAGAAKKVGATLKGDTGIFRKLQQEHGEVSSLLHQVASNHEDIDLRRALYPKIRAELLSHARAEEMEFYPVFERHVETRDIAVHCREQHKEIEQTIDELDTLGVDSPRWAAVFDQLCDKVVAHVEEEEEHLFPRADDLVSREQAANLQNRFESEKHRQLARF